MLGSPSRTGCDGVHFPVHRGWNGRCVSMAGVCYCVKEHVSFLSLSMLVDKLNTAKNIRYTDIINNHQPT